MANIARFAENYVRKYGIAVVKIEPGTKGPRGKGWNQPGGYFTDSKEAEAFFSDNPNWNMGAVLGPSGLCSIDVDNVEYTTIVLSRFGIDIHEIASTRPTIVGNPARFRVMFSVPGGAQLERKALTWPNPDDPDGSKHSDLIRRAVAAKNEGNQAEAERLRAEAKKFARVTVAEFRSGLVQDVLPPSIHPGTGRPYEWRTKPNGNFPALDPRLLELWNDWDNFKIKAEALCPWASIKQQPAAVSLRQPAPVTREGISVIDAFNQAHTIEDELARYGYERRDGRYLSPHSSTGMPGVWIQSGHNRCWIEHASDPLCSSNSKRPVGPFDLFCYYEHGGDTRQAVKAAAEALGLKPAPRQKPPANVDTETGEIIEPTQPDRPGSVDYITWLSDVNDKGKPLATIQNVMDICERLGIKIRYNVISKEEEIIIPGAGFSLDNRQNASLSYLLSECAKFRMPTDKVPDFVTYIADQNQFNPVANWITSSRWDGEDRLSQLVATVTAAGESHAPRIGAMKRAMMTRWMISAVAAAFRPNGVSAHGVLVFQGDQYLGKTKWFKSLVPQELGVLQDGVILRPEDRDSVKQCVSNWLVELGELDATFRKSDIAALKAFLTKDKDVLRRAYARRESEFARRTVFFASVNPKEFLHDPTGNRRYWTIECEHLDYDHGIDMQQCWAQVYEQHYLAGESWFLTADEMDSLNDHNKGFEVIDPIEELIINGLDWESPSTVWNWRSATEVLKELGRDTPTLAEATRAAHVIRMRNGRMSKKSNGVRSLLVPRRI